MTVSDEDEVKMIQLVIYAVATVIIVFFLTVSGCTMHSHAYGPELAKEETAQIQAKALSDQQRIKALKELIDTGVNPVAARCAVYGYSGSDAGARCERSAKEINK